MNENLKKGTDYTGVSVVFFCHDGKGKFLMSRRSVNTRDEHGKWDLGGGGVEFGHTIEETLRKELREEYCIEPIVHEFLGYMDVHREHQGRTTHWIALVFKVLVDPVSVRIGEPDMCDELGWFTLDSLPDNLHSQFPKLLELYGDQLV